MYPKTHIAQTAQSAQNVPSAHTTQQAKPQRSLPTLSQPAKTAIRLFVAGAVFLVVGIIAWNKLRAEFDESYKRFSSCHSVASNRTA